MNEKMKKGRGGSKKGQSKNVGSKHGNSLLTEDDVREIHKFLSSNVLTCREIGERYNVTDHTIFKIKSGKNWRHVKPIENNIKDSVTRDRMLEIREFFNRSGCFVDHNLIEIIYTAVQALKELPENKNLTT